MYFVYLLKSKKDNQFYIGHTNNIERRLKEHNSGLSRSTRARRPFVLVGCEKYPTQSTARWRERQLKKSAFKRKQFIEQFYIRG
ncbi:MAG: GIY-YIG nuclease family protein [Patescibacteria group bacterium]